MCGRSAGGAPEDDAVGDRRAADAVVSVYAARGFARCEESLDRAARTVEHGCPGVDFNAARGVVHGKALEPVVERRLLDARADQGDVKDVVPAAVDRAVPVVDRLLEYVGTHLHAERGFFKRIGSPHDALVELRAERGPFGRRAVGERPHDAFGLLENFAAQLPKEKARTREALPLCVEPDLAADKVEKPAPRVRHDLNVGHADQAGLLRWLAAFYPSPKQIFVVHGESSVCDEFARLVSQHCHIPAIAPYYSSSWELNPLRQIDAGIPREQMKPRSKSSSSSVFSHLMDAGQRLLDVIQRNRGGANKDLIKFTNQINDLCDKWDL